MPEDQPQNVGPQPSTDVSVNYKVIEPSSNFNTAATIPIANVDKTTLATEQSPPNILSQLQSDDMKDSLVSDSELAAVTSTTQSLTNSSEKPIKVAKKSLKFIITIVACSLLFGGGISFALVSWYENPQKVIGDAIVNAAMAKTYTYAVNVDASSTTGNSSAATKMTASAVLKKAEKSMAVSSNLIVQLGGVGSNTSMKFSVDGIMDEKDNLYFKLDGLSAPADYVKSLMGVTDSSAVAKAIDQLVTGTDKKWVKVASGDLSDFNKGYSKAQTCLNDTIDKYKADPTLGKEIVDLYGKNQFIVISKQLGVKDGSIGYQVDENKTTEVAFLKALVNTKIYKMLNSCDSETFSIDTKDLSSVESSSQASENKPKVEVWVNQLTHQFTKVSMTESQKNSNANVVILFDFNKAVMVSVPSDSMNFSKFVDYLNGVIKAFQAEMETRYSSLYTNSGL